MSTWRKVDIFIRLGFVVVLVIVAALALSNEMNTVYLLNLFFICLASSFIISGVIAFLFKEKKAGWVNSICGLIMFAVIIWFY